MLSISTAKILSRSQFLINRETITSTWKILCSFFHCQAVSEESAWTELWPCLSKHPGYLILAYIGNQIFGLPTSFHLLIHLHPLTSSVVQVLEDPSFTQRQEGWVEFLVYYYARFSGHLCCRQITLPNKVFDHFWNNPHCVYYCICLFYLYF